MMFWPILVLGGLLQPDTDASLAEACQQMVPWVQRQLGAQGQILVRPPLVLGGDLTAAELDRWYRETLEPAARAMAANYFVRRPDRPVVVLLFASEQSYRQAARRVFGDTQVSSYGYYKPQLHTLLVNTSRGTAGALHELTHALMAFDFGDAPPWLAEGLAALHEDCLVSCDPPRLGGRVNWRLATLQRALAESRLPPLVELLDRKDFDGPDQALCYAYARYFCLYLERRGLLADVYRRMRNARQRSPAATMPSEGLIPGTALTQLDVDFRRFAAALVQ